ncbi:hypothetical protein DESC_590058 [Desulfosarcina cetonica]|nr:hypothetical protein DESC_590058 [Desulfosarcina cetonica]
MDSAAYFNGQIAIHHQMDEVMQHTYQKGRSITGKQRDLEHHRQRQGFLGAHENDRLAASRTDCQHPTNAEGHYQQDGVKDDCQGNDQKGDACLFDQHLAGRAKGDEDDQQHDGLVDHAQLSFSLGRDGGQTVLDAHADPQGQENQHQQFDENGPLVDGQGSIQLQGMQQQRQGQRDGDDGRAVGEDGHKQGVGDVPASLAGHDHPAGKGRGHGGHQHDSQSHAGLHGQADQTGRHQWGRDKNQHQGGQRGADIPDAGPNLVDLDDQAGEEENHDDQHRGAMVVFQQDAGARQVERAVQQYSGKHQGQADEKPMPFDRFHEFSRSEGHGLENPF